MGTRDPFDRATAVPSFTLTSTTVADGRPLDRPQFSGLFGVEGGTDTSPQLSWSGAPEGVKSWLVTVYDPDAPTQSGFWHWVVAGLPAGTSALPENAGDPDAGLLPEGAFHVAGDGGVARYLGAAPPAGDEPHRYVTSVFALDTDDVSSVRDARPAVVEFMLREHVIARASLVPIGSLPAD